MEKLITFDDLLAVLDTVDVSDSKTWSDARKAIKNYKYKAKLDDNDPPLLIMQSTQECDLIRPRLLALAIGGYAIHIPTELYDQVR